MSEAKETFLRITNTITRTSGEFIKSARLSINLASEEDRLKTLYTEIGKKVHEIYAYGGTLGAAFDENIAAVELQQEKINDLKNKIDAVKGTKSCAGCGKTMDRGAEFCPKCGRRTGEPREIKKDREPYAANAGAAPDDPPVTDPAPSAVPVKTCGLCGKENEADSKFCFHCGRVL